MLLCVEGIQNLSELLEELDICPNICNRKVIEVIQL